MKWSVKTWTPKRGNEKFEVEAADSQKAIKKAQKQIRMKGSGEVSVWPYKQEKGKSVKSTPKAVKEKKERKGAAANG